MATVVEYLIYYKHIINPAKVQISVMGAYRAYAKKRNFAAVFDDLINKGYFINESSSILSFSFLRLSSFLLASLFLIKIVFFFSCL